MTSNNSLPSAGAIILAAGSATRMRQLKQVLEFRGATLVQYAAEQALSAGFDPVFVVAGAEAAKVRQALAGMPVQIVENPNWQLGIGSSIACGMRALSDVASELSAAAILLADQPLVTARHLQQMRALLSPGAAAVAAEYAGSLGVPAIFTRAMFPALMSLAPQEGAKRLLGNSTANVVAFPLAEAAVDIDTPEDYARITA